MQAKPGREGDHGAVVGAELVRRVEDLEASPLGLRVERRPELPVGADAAGHHQSVQTRSRQRAETFRDQDFDHGVHEGARDVRGCRLAAPRELAEVIWRCCLPR